MTQPFRCARPAALQRIALITAVLLPVAPALAADRYVDAREFPDQVAGWERFRRVEAALVRGFDGVCGDTFCEGEYANLQPQRFRCSVQASSGTVHECIWTFAGSTARVDAQTGEVLVDARSWACRVPLADRTPLALLLATLEGPQPIDAVLPGTRLTVYDGLTACL